jgi:hypothetical protein
MYDNGIFTSAYKDLREGVAAKGGVIAKKGAAPAKKEDPKAKGDKEEKGANTSDEDRVKQALYDIRYRAKRESVPVGQAMTDYLKHSGSLGPKARAELKKRLMGEETETIEEKKKGLWDNIHAKRKRGEAPAKKGDEDYPKTLNVEADMSNAPSIKDAKPAKKTNVKHYKGLGIAPTVAKEETEEVEEGLKPYPTEKVARKREAVKRKEDIHVARGEYDKADKQYKRGVSLAMKTKMKKEEVEIGEGLKQARKNVGASTCWDGYKAKGTKKKDGKEVPNCVKEGEEETVQRRQLQLNRKKLQLQTKATQAKKKTDMSMRTEELIILNNILENADMSYMHEIAEERVKELISLEEAETQKKGPSGDTLYKVRVVNNDGRSEVRYASRAKIGELRGNSNIKSVEITGHGDAYNEKPKAKGGEKKLDPVGKEDGDVDNDGDKDKSDKYLMKRRKAIGKAIATREETESLGK